MLPVLFVGHGSPMIALEESERTENFKQIGKEIIDKHKPEGILSISAHWFRTENRVQSSSKPEQVYDMSGFPKELYQVKYEPEGNRALTDKVIDILGDKVLIDDSWGIDHGTWSVLVHMFPKVDIPVVQLNVNMIADFPEMYDLGQQLSELRNKYLIIGSGNIVHNLWKVDWNNKYGSDSTVRFDSYIKSLILNNNYDEIFSIENHPDYKYAVPTKDHFSPLLYTLGAAKDSKAEVFNEGYNLGSISMTSYIFGR